MAVWLCPTCDTNTATGQCIECESCLEWYHLECARITKKPKQNCYHMYEFLTFILDSRTKAHISQVQLKPPTNLTVFYKQSSLITIGWDAPEVYDLQFNDTSYENVNITDSSMGPMNSSSDQLVNNSTSENSTDSGVSVSIASGVKCLPYSVLKKSAEEIIDTTLTFEMNAKESVLNNTNVNLVPYSQGCVQKYRIKWQEAEGKSKNVSFLEVSATETVANISGLKVNTNYSITVSAVYSINNSAKIVDKELESSVLIVSTTSHEISTVCQCDWHGSISPLMNCDKNRCICKPGYFGEFCQMCAPGFYRTSDFYQCHRCPCQPPGAIIPICSLVEGFLECIRCQPGYTGNLCHMCDNGFYRFGKKCIPCNCNGNTMKNETNMCHPITG
ncbi:Laminin subunit alpha-3 [Bulinus truncatus]|nr:Laminin subunit alpha-3 [Bulinus truncatus]